MREINFNKAIETLEAQKVNGQFDQVINETKVQLHNLQKAEEKAKEDAEEQRKWGLTKKEYDDVIHTFDYNRNPTDCAYEFNNKQLKLLAHKWVTYRNLYNVVDAFKTFDELCEYIIDNLDYYFNIDQVIDDNFDLVDEDDLYQALIDARSEAYETDENGNLILEEAE